jgi:hypothetical protein
VLGVAWSFSQPRGTHIYISSRVSGQTILPDCFSYSLLHRHRFSSPFCRESILRVYGSIHGCVDFLLVARSIFMSFSGYFRWIFVRAWFLRFWGVWVQISWWGSWIDVLCMFVLEHDPSNSGLDLWLKDFGWNPSSFGWNPSTLCELGRISIPLDLVGLGLQICRYIIS